MSARAALLLILLPLVPAAGSAEMEPRLAPAATPEKLRQTGQAAGKLRDTPKELLCEQAEEQAWSLVWASCPRGKQVLEAVTSACITTDYVSDSNRDCGPTLTVEVQVEYRCR